MKGAGGTPVPSSPVPGGAEDVRWKLRGPLAEFWLSRGSAGVAVASEHAPYLKEACAVLTSRFCDRPFCRRDSYVSC